MQLDTTVAVIIPCYNQAHFLGEAIESALEQTHPHVEIVVVDDGSTDHTKTVAAQHSAVRYVYQPNQGLPAARNTGIRESSADYILFLDADDRLLPHALETGLRYMRANPECAFVSGHYYFIAKDGSFLASIEQQFVANDHFTALLQGNYIGMIATVLYRRSAVLAVGSFNPTLPVCEDYDLNLRIARRFPAYCHAEIVAEYRKHDANMSMNAGLMLKTALAVLRWQGEHITDENGIKAFERGLSSWQSYYGEILREQIVEDLKDRRLLRVINESVDLIRYAPRYLRKLVYRQFKRRMQMRLRALLPVFLQRILARRRKTEYTPAVGNVRFGDLYRNSPISDQFGYDRGQPIDRYYIEKFLARHQQLIRGRVLEIGDREYTEKYGGERVVMSDVLHVNKGNPIATLVGDLTHADHIPDNQFDCVIITQTLHLIYEVEAALRTVYRILRPGGTLLATVPGITQISKDEWSETWYWAFTVQSIRRLLEDTFYESHIEVKAHGNVLAATAFLQGIALEEVDRADLEHTDSQYQLLITACVRKSATAQRSDMTGATSASTIDQAHLELADDQEVSG